MSEVILHRDDLHSILKWIDKYPSCEWVTISVDSSSGIGSIVKAKINTAINEDFVTIEKTFVDESGW